MKVGDDSWGVVGSDRLPQSQEEEEEPPPPARWMDGRCLYMCVHACMCVSLVHHSLLQPWLEQLCLVSSSLSGALLPCQRMMSYLRHINTGTGESDTPCNGF